MLHEATWIHLLDSGGQPQFTDLLRMFVRGNSLYIIVMKVTESLHDKPTFVFSIEGKPLNAPKEMTMTNLQIIERFVRSVAATSREDNSEPAFAIVATHCDQRSKYKQFLGSEESIEMKNKTLQSHLSDFLHLFVFYNHNSDELIFPVNNLCQENREKLSADICNRLVSDVRFNINIPVRWYAFDLDIKNEASKETHGMISLESCYSIGQRLEMDKEEGLFPTLVVSLLGREEEPKFFIDSRTFEFPRQLRHAVKLYAPSLFAAVFLCENNESIDVYFTGCPQHCYHLRKVILEALSVSVKVLEYDESKLNMSALIRCNREHIERAHDKKNHPITISLDLSQIGCSVESSLPTIAISDLIERKRCWLIPTASVCEPAPLPVDDNALLNHTHAPAILDAIDSVVDEWQRLGQKLGISDKMLRQFKYNSRDQVQVCRKDMIYYWIDARCATCHKLKSALKSMGENGIVSEIQRLQTAK
uniref:Death domain-containing protein n=1 Tax=Amphimedon queenslandica TaxID=400682 RepID=A0A1X7SUQ4_AMPQE